MLLDFSSVSDRQQISLFRVWKADCPAMGNVLG